MFVLCQFKQNSVGAKYLYTKTKTRRPASIKKLTTMFQISIKHRESYIFWHLIFWIVWSK